jgi:hypothetical protein
MDYNPAPLPTTRTSVPAIISLIAGIAGWSFLPFLGAIVAVITGHIAKSEIKKSNGYVTGGGMATAGLIMGYISVALGLCAICIFGLTFAGLITLPFAFPVYGQ